jgi:hypothetical protein
MKYNLDTQDDHRFYRINTSSLSYVLYTGELQISEVKYESLCDESITTIKKREKQLIDGITKHSEKLQNEVELVAVLPSSEGLVVLISRPIASYSVVTKYLCSISKYGKDACLTLPNHWQSYSY